MGLIPLASLREEKDALLAPLTDEKRDETDRDEAMGVRRPIARWLGVPGLEARGEARRGVEGVDRLCSAG